jgi:DNA-directed RNA polymerase specialized sigma24 family protein
MNLPDADHDAAPVARGVFATTHWSVVLAAGKGDAPDSEQALALLCRHYWYPLYAFVRQQGQDVHAAQDLTQEFFARLLARNWLAAADPDRGRFRTFLLTALKRFLANEWDRARAQKRGGGVQPLPLDFDAGEQRLVREPATAEAPDAIFVKRWALELLHRTLERLRAEYAGRGKGELFARLEDTLTGHRTDDTYGGIAHQLGLSEAAVKMQAMRLRRRFSELLREEIAHTVATPEDVEEELRFLSDALRR